MAINFLNSVNLNQNELQKARIQNAANNELAGAGVDGQLYFNTTDFQLKAWANGSWGNVGGGVTSVNASVEGTALDVGGVPITSTGTIQFTWSGTANDYVTGNGTIAAFPTSLNGITQGEIIDVTYPNPLAPTVSHADVSRNNNTNSISPGYGSSFEAISSITTSAQGHVSDVTTTTITLPASDDTTYALTNTATANPVVRLTPSTGAADEIRFSGATGEVTVGASASGQINIGLPNTVSTKRLVLSGSSTDDISLSVAKDASIARDLTVGGAGSFVEEVTVPTATATTSAVNLGQVRRLVSGTGGFRGSYDAANNVPALQGVNNVALTTGDYYAVSDAGTFFSLSVVAGDFIYANDVIPANTDPDFEDYTVVQSATVIATAGVDDAATTKGIAGFDSENFTVSSNGWVQLKGLSNPYGRSVLLDESLTYIDRTVGGGATEYTVNIANPAVFGSGAAAMRIKAEIVEQATGETVYAVVKRSSNENIVFEFIGTVTNGTYRILLTYV